MRAFVCEVDHHGLRRLLPEDLIPRDELGRLARRRPPRATTVVWALLSDGDAEDLRADVHAGRHREACGLLLNRAAGLLALGSLGPGPARGPDGRHG